MIVFRRRALAGVLCASLALGMPTAARADNNTGCGQRTEACKIVVKIKKTIGGSNKPAKKVKDGGSEKSSLPTCEDLNRRGGLTAPPPGADRAEWVQVSCIEGGLPITLWVRRTQAQVDPSQIAQTLLARLQLRRISIGMTPKGPDAMALVGLPVWLWVADPTRTSWGPATISAGGVTLTARVDSVTWSLGDGTVLSCGKGSVWKRGMGAKPSPTCGHTYTRRGVYPVSATTHWVARWSGHGQAGTVRLDLVSSRRLEVGEVQVNGTGG